VAFAAFYADCVHEVQPVTAGHRLTLIYNLIRRGKGRGPQPPEYGKQQTQAAALLRAWGTGQREADEDLPTNSSIRWRMPTHKRTSRFTR